MLESRRLLAVRVPWCAVWLVVGSTLWLPACDDDSSAGEVTEDVASDAESLRPDTPRPDLAPADAADDGAATGTGDGGGEPDAAAEDTAGEVGEDVPAADAPGNEVGDDAGTDLAAEDAAAETAPDLAFDVVQGQVASLSIDWLSEGGFTGFGHRDYHYAVGALSMYYPYSDPSECADVLAEEEVGELHAAAAAVNWGAVGPLYVTEENPDCCCDYFYYGLTVDITFVNGDPIHVESAWCGAEEAVALLPADLRAMLDVLTALGDDLLYECAGI